ncbi:MAG: nicotinate-nucleotide adenylyltransferase [Promethearchaeota archaeon]|nr:MAG: nicotinate-nucleotide adenylyltransferase [Candidatus Lokiarchaeota archaeon]
MKQVKGTRFETGVIHGRFQILHNDHVKFLLAGKKLCDHLIVGITNPDPSLTKDHDSNPHRSTLIANPMTYYERYVMVRETLLENSLEFSEFSIVPFPINVPELLKYYAPMDAVFFLSIYDDWGRQKKEYLETLELKVHVLWEVSIEEKGLSGSDIRSSMLKGEPWEHFLPATVVKLVKEWNIVNRLINLGENK